MYEGEIEDTMLHVGFTIYQDPYCSTRPTQGRMKIALNHDHNCQQWFGEEYGYIKLECNGRDTVRASYFGDNHSCSGSPLFALDVNLDNLQIPETLVDDINDLGIVEELTNPVFVGTAEASQCFQAVEDIAMSMRFDTVVPINIKLLRLGTYPIVRLSPILKVLIFMVTSNKRVSMISRATNKIGQ